MITGEIKSQIDRIWDAFWSGGIANPMEVIEQMTYLLFIKRLDELHTVREKKANRLNQAIENPLFNDQQQHLRWSVFKQLGDPKTMFETVAEEVFPFMKELGSLNDTGDTADDTGEATKTTYATHMQDARFTIPTPALLSKVVDRLDAINMDDRDTKGDVYEYMLGKIASAGTNGQFRTPRHIIKLMVELMAPKPADTICDPACGTAGFLVAASEYLLDHHQSDIYQTKASAKRFNHDTFHGFDFDSTMLRVGSMNMLLHGVENPAIENRDSLSEGHAGVAEQFSLILANPPFKGSLDYESTAKDLLATVKTKKTELLFLALILRLLKVGGRAAVIVPDGVLTGNQKAHKTLRQTIVEDHQLNGIISMPSGVFKPYAGVSTAIVIFTKTNSGGTDHVWFYDMQADGYSLDDKRTPLLSKSDDKTDNASNQAANDLQHANNNLPDILNRWQSLTTGDKEANRARTEQSFLVSKAEIADNDYDLSVNRYKEIVYESVEYAPPLEILTDLKALEQEIQIGMNELEAMLT